MIVFKTIRWKNFLSTGNQFNEIQLNKHKSTLITGKNGEGKSTILCALTFGLFGKPFRNVNKGQLVNSINQKNCLVELEFAISGHNYIVRRGIKPNIFEIYCDDALINQDAANKDYQKVLEQQILKLNYKTFTQVVILGAATFVPFMQLSSNQRREVIEDILDIRVFSVMNVLLKEKHSICKDQISSIENAIATHKVKVQSQKKLIEALEASKKNVVDSLKSKIETNNQQISASASNIELLNFEIENLRQHQTKQKTISDGIQQLSKIKDKVTADVDRCAHDIRFFNSNDQCPTCTQDIAVDHKTQVLNELNSKINDYKKKCSDSEQLLEKLTNQLNDVNQILNKISDLNIEISTQTNKIKILTDQNVSLANEIQSVGDDVGDVKEEKQRMKGLAEEAIELITTKSELLNQRELYDVAGMLLKDTGIKTAIIKEYLPVMNKLINRYLDAMDFFVKFELDESFQETIKSRNRDTFTYDSFSEGEKRRLDLAVLFTWRQIAKMKNSVNTNILILDEILDGALDSGGIDYFLSIMNQFGDQTNVFVISHKVDQMVDRFDHVIRVEKRNDFSIISTS